MDPHIQEACTAMCAFDQPTVDGTRCHFTTVSASTCYLGTLGEETNLLTNPTSSSFSLKTSKPQHQISGLSHKLCFSDALYMEGFRTAKFPYSTTTGGSKQDLIFNKLAGIAYTEDTCASLCYTHSPSTPVCHFFILDGTACALGNFGGFNGTQHALTSPTLTAYYNESGSKWCHGGNKICCHLIDYFQSFFTLPTSPVHIQSQQHYQPLAGVQRCIIPNQQLQWSNVQRSAS